MPRDVPVRFSIGERMGRWHRAGATGSGSGSFVSDIHAFRAPSGALRSDVSTFDVFDAVAFGSQKQSLGGICISCIHFSRVGRYAADVFLDVTHTMRDFVDFIEALAHGDFSWFEIKTLR